MRLHRLARLVCSLCPPVLLLTAFSHTPLAWDDTCSGVALSGDAQWISCAGNCDVGGPPSCKVGTRTDAKGQYKYCGCKDSNGNIPESVCCHLVARAPTPDHPDPWLDVRGVCLTNLGCALTDGRWCQLVSEQPVCAGSP